jgi:UDP-N-acetylglucosamine 2-epimerase
MSIITVIGARPQFIKAAPLGRALAAAGLQEQLLHTGQHYDAAMSDVFFEELGIPRPAWHLGLGGGRHGEMTGAMLRGIEEVLLQEKPELVIVYGDTNSTLAGALAAAKLHIPIAHVEAGLRSFNRAMPEEINRVCADHVSTLLLCSSDVGASHLQREGITKGVHVVGDVMVDALNSALEAARKDPNRLKQLMPHGPAEGFALITLHRQENTDDLTRLRGILAALTEWGGSGVFPIHPRTRQILTREGLSLPPSIRLIDPVGYFDMAALLEGCAFVVTDSGGLQKEAYWAHRPCLTLRDQTEWVEIVETGWAVLLGADTPRILAALNAPPRSTAHPPLYGDGQASRRVAEIIAQFLTAPQA